MHCRADKSYLPTLKYGPFDTLLDHAIVVGFVALEDEAAAHNAIPSYRRATSKSAGPRRTQEI
jgi:hypothetical protein